MNFNTSKIKHLIYICITLFAVQSFAGDSRFGQILNNNTPIFQIDHGDEASCRAQANFLKNARFICSDISAEKMLTATGKILDTQKNIYLTIHLVSDFECDYQAKSENEKLKNSMICDHKYQDSTSGSYFQIFNEIKILIQFDYNSAEKCSKEYANTTDKSSSKCTNISAAEIMKFHGRLIDASDNSEAIIHFENKQLCDGLAEAARNSGAKQKILCE
jgi:hypothetical protein